MGTLFVYGTLKNGFANFSANQGELVAIHAKTTLRFPLRIVGRYKIPWLLPSPGQGKRITGELYRVNQSALCRLDRLEGVHHPAWFIRSRVIVRVRASRSIRLTGAWVYFGKASNAIKQGASRSTFAEFTPSHNLAYIKNAA